MIHIKKYSLFILLIVFFASCKKSPDSFSISDFPVKVGDTWTFQRYDSLSLITDTVVWFLPTIVSVNGKSMYLWVQASATQSDTGYWAVCGDTVTFYAKGIIYGATDYFILPIQSGSKWSETPLGGAPDQYTCSGSNNLVVNGKNYSNVFVFNRLESGLDASVIENIDMVKGIGIISYHSHMVNQGFTDIYQLSLLSYTLN
jgi:hypothetical protein